MSGLYGATLSSVKTAFDPNGNVVRTRDEITGGVW